MKYSPLFMIALAFVAGCSQNHASNSAKDTKPAEQASPTPSTPTPSEAPSPKPTPAVAPAPSPEPGPTPAASPTPASAPATSHANQPTNLYFEFNKEGKTYVLGYVSTLKLVREGRAPADLDEKPSFGPDGETVIFEKDADGLEKRLIDEYQKQHPRK